MDPTPAHHDSSDGAPAEPMDGTGPVPMNAQQKLAFRIVSASTVPVWAAMILLPNARFTERVVKLATPLYAALGVAYVGFLATEVATGDGGMPSFDDPDALREALGSPTAFLAGWTHYIVFDLFVGRYIWSEARARGRNDRLALFLTWMAGPAGLTLHLARNAIGGAGGDPEAAGA